MSEFDSDDISPPDWERHKVFRESDGVHVGDPTRWGASIATVLDDSGGPIVINTPQFLQVATRDGYSRSWSALGTLVLPSAAWAGNDQLCELIISMGVGQIQIAQAIALYSGNSPSPAGGLCITQHQSQGGPYDSIIQGASESRSFAIVGGLVGQSFAVRARYRSSGFPPTAGWPTTALLSMIVTPYAAGEGL